MTTYYTPGVSGRITIFNHTDQCIYASVSASVSGSTRIYPVGAGISDSWARAEEEQVHISMGGLVAGQSAQVFSGHPGKILHIQKLDVDPVWLGIKSVLVEDATYSLDTQPAERSYIGIQNDLPFDIYVSVPRSGSVPDGATAQYLIKPGATDRWARDYPEVVLVSVGGAPGAPRAFLGRVGSILHINTLR